MALFLAKPRLALLVPRETRKRLPLFLPKWAAKVSWLRPGARLLRQKQVLSALLSPLWTTVSTRANRENNMMCSLPLPVLVKHLTSSLNPLELFAQLVTIKVGL